MRNLLKQMNELAFPRRAPEAAAVTHNPETEAMLSDARLLIIQFFGEMLPQLSKCVRTEDLDHAGVLAFNLGSLSSDLRTAYTKASSGIDPFHYPAYDYAYNPNTAAQFLAALHEHKHDYTKVFCHDWRAASIYAHESRQAVIDHASYESERSSLGKFYTDNIKPLKEFEQAFGLFMRKHSSVISTILTDVYEQWEKTGLNRAEPLHPSKIWNPEAAFGGEPEIISAKKLETRTSKSAIAYNLFD